MSPGSVSRDGGRGSGLRRLGAGAALAVLALTATGGGCLDEPEIEDRWTRVDLVRTNLVSGQPVAFGQMLQVDGRAEIVYRRIVTGFAVCELRASAVYGPGTLGIHPNAPRPGMAVGVDSLLRNSVSVGRATRGVTGWDHLIQGVDFSFAAGVPATLPSRAPVAGLFLVCYLGSGVEVEQADGTDSLVVTPFPSATYEILPIGITLSPAAPGTP